MPEVIEHVHNVNEPFTALSPEALPLLSDIGTTLEKLLEGTDEMDVAADLYNSVSPSIRYKFQQRHLYGLTYAQALRLIEAYECEVNCMYPMFPMGNLESKFHNIYEQYCINKTLTAKEEDDFADIKIAIAIGSSISGISPGSGQRLYQDFMARIEGRLLSRAADLNTVVSLLMVHSYQFLSDLGSLAYRSLEFASVLALELGLHKTQKLERLFLDFESRERGRVVFWCLYVLDRLQSIYCKRPYILNDVHIDQKYPQCFDNQGNGTSMDSVQEASSDDDLFRSMYLNYMIRYSKLSGELISALEQNQPDSFGNIQHLIFLMERWRTTLPPELNVHAEDNEDLVHKDQQTPIGSRKLRYVADLRPSLILLHVYQSCDIKNYIHPAMNTSCECIRELGRLYFNTDRYSSCETQYNHVLVAALEVLYTSLTWAPQYAKSCMPEIKLALKIISLIMKSSNSHRREGSIWQLLMTFSLKFGLYSPFGAAKLCDSTNASSREFLITNLISELGDFT
ncbi:hypothetical protein AWJ20_5195 [Sugiyamaella lignohabitans]|uniref:Xylanolytic transcriptional activator regulatory domain-containing protein n=1 Tax=Sugiyamaella lignohabitans TaxID=796027 RepID=A0A167ELZ8_9ASCO|nr:uncharacterized protein AWJ20_5195 [Sugiyamaella lignohabitans]ANB14234.1 hypothetical protein AWJ20_5195 [Sugiyamaella lignohabitans]